MDIRQVKSKIPTLYYKKNKSLNLKKKFLKYKVPNKSIIVITPKNANKCSNSICKIIYTPKCKLFPSSKHNTPQYNSSLNIKTMSIVNLSKQKKVEKRNNKIKHLKNSLSSKKSLILLVTLIILIIIIILVIIIIIIIYI